MSFPQRIVSISFAFLHRVAQCTLIVLFNFLHLTVCFSKDKVFPLSRNDKRYTANVYGGLPWFAGCLTSKQIQLMLY